MRSASRARSLRPGFSRACSTRSQSTAAAVLNTLAPPAATAIAVPAGTTIATIATITTAFAALAPPANVSTSTSGRHRSTALPGARRSARGTKRSPNSAWQTCSPRSAAEAGPVAHVARRHPRPSAQ